MFSREMSGHRTPKRVGRQKLNHLTIASDPMNSIALGVDRLRIYRMSFLLAPVRRHHIENEKVKMYAPIILRPCHPPTHIIELNENAYMKIRHHT